MLAYLRGTVLEKGEGRAVVEVGGLGYELHLTPSGMARLPAEGGEAELFLFESIGLYGGQVTLYAFLSREERELFACLRDHVPGTGAKKALEYLEKASRSLPDFRRAVLDEDVRALCEVFAFTRKTAERLLAGLKGKLGSVEPPAGAARFRREALGSPVRAEALSALASLGYRPAECRQALEALQLELPGGIRDLPVEQVLRLALRKM